MPYFNIAILSTPMPKAKPRQTSGSYLTVRNTLGSTIPAPNISSHPLNEHTRQPVPPQIMQEISISALGSVKGKKWGRKRIRVSSPNISRTNTASVPFKSEKVISLSTLKPST